ncbi:hypothetical protein [Herbaspirillum huttiense]|uniref:hypothetical protein n=1 Tax=Herbaspirillum huttiense TaxID=863372 RepID=UPI002176A212|nr:hypothetical protein [Herbaspirillum huttiense]UWE14769.1 hypothetical protein NY669_16845 [Herbaspirillum huttiense]
MDIHIFWEQACGKALGKRIKSLIAKGIHHQGSGWAIGGQSAGNSGRRGKEKAMGRPR